MLIFSGCFYCGMLLLWNLGVKGSPEPAEGSPWPGWAVEPAWPLGWWFWFKCGPGSDWFWLQAGQGGSRGSGPAEQLMVLSGSEDVLGRWWSDLLTLIMSVCVLQEKPGRRKIRSSSSSPPDMAGALRYVFITTTWVRTSRTPPGTAGPTATLDWACSVERHVTNLRSASWLPFGPEPEPGHQRLRHAAEALPRQRVSQKPSVKSPAVDSSRLPPSGFCPPVALWLAGATLGAVPALWNRALGRFWLTGSRVFLWETVKGSQKKHQTGSRWTQNAGSASDCRRFWFWFWLQAGVSSSSLCSFIIIRPGGSVPLVLVLIMVLALPACLSGCHSSSVTSSAGWKPRPFLLWDSGGFPVVGFQEVTETGGGGGASVC